MSRTTAFPTVRGIVPPYLLGRLAEEDLPQGIAARATLARDSKRRRRRNHPTPTIVAGVTAPATGPTRLISDAGHIQRLPGRIVRREGSKPTQDQAVDEAYDGFGATWRLFHEVFKRNSIDASGMHLLGSVHYGDGYQNAFWNGTRMVFGDGDGEIFGRFTASLDVIGHELTHGVVEHTAALIYANQAGALNESLADVFGILVKQYQNQEMAKDSDWIIGADLLLPGVDGTGLRNMLHPGTAYDDPRLGTDPQPAHMRDYVKTRDDNGGVHYNSGIPNRAFALSSTVLGGKAWERAGWIWFDAMTSDVIPAACDFATFAAITLASAESRFGRDSEEWTAVENSWKKVGVVPGQVPTERAATPSVDPNAEVVVRRTGGFAGLARERRTALSELNERDRTAWQGLLTGHALPALATAGSHPDGYIYDVACPSVDLDLALPEPALPSDVKGLFERFLAD